MFTPGVALAASVSRRRREEGAEFHLFLRLRNGSGQLLVFDRMRVHWLREVERGVEGILGEEAPWLEPQEAAPGEVLELPEHATGHQTERLLAAAQRGLLLLEVILELTKPVRGHFPGPVAGPFRAAIPALDSLPEYEDLARRCQAGEDARGHEPRFALPESLPVTLGTFSQPAS